MEPREELKLEIVSVEVQKITKPRPKEITQGAIESEFKKIKPITKKEKRKKKGW